MGDNLTGEEKWTLSVLEQHTTNKTSSWPLQTFKSQSQSSEEK